VGIPAERMNQLVSVALSLEGSKESDFSSRQMSLLERMAVRLEYPNVETMIQQRLPALLTSEGEPGQWTTTSPSWRILQFVAGELKMIDSYVFDLLRQTISSNPNPEVKLKSFNMLTASMEHLQSIDPAQLQAILLASVKWKPGRSASVLRSSAALCAYAAIHHRKLEIIPSNLNTMADSFVDLVEDEVVNTRLAAIKILQHCLFAGRPTNLDSILTSITNYFCLFPYKFA
jgi:hypothetical protein